MYATIPQPETATAPPRRVLCDLCWAPVGKPCTVSGPPGDHLQRYITVARLGLITRAELAEVVAGLAVIAAHVVILERAE